MAPCTCEGGCCNFYKHLALNAYVVVVCCHPLLCCEWLRANLLCHVTIFPRHKSDQFSTQISVTTIGKNSRLIPPLESTKMYDKIMESNLGYCLSPTLSHQPLRCFVNSHRPNRQGDNEFHDLVRLHLWDEQEGVVREQPNADAR